MKRKSFTCFALALALGLSNAPAVYAVDALALEASWTANTVKITFDSNGGGVPPEYQIYAYGVSRSMPGQCSMSKDGYHFLGWSESKTAKTPTWKGGDTSTEAFGYASETQAVAKTLYAVWSTGSSSSDDSVDLSKVKVVGVNSGSKDLVYECSGSGKLVGLFAFAYTVSTASEESLNYVYLTIDDKRKNIINLSTAKGYSGQMNYYLLWKDLVIGADNNSGYNLFYFYPYGDRFNFKAFNDVNILPDNDFTLSRVTTSNYANIFMSPIKFTNLKLEFQNKNNPSSFTNRLYLAYIPDK